MKKSMIILFFLVWGIVACAKKVDQPYLVASTPDYGNILPTSDGVVLLTIEIPDNHCFSADDNINVKFTFWNLTNEPITLANSFSNGSDRRFRYNLIIDIEDEAGSQYTIHTSYPRIVPYPDTEYIELSGGDFIETTLEYPFFQVEDIYFTSSETVTPEGETFEPTINYSLRFLYENTNAEHNSWVGLVSSNQITLCLVH